MTVTSNILDLFAENLTVHGFKKHAGQFRDERSNGSRNKPSETRGDPIPMSQPEDMRNHIKATMHSPDTKYVVDEATGRMMFFNQKTNTLIVFNPDQMANGDGMAGTLMRTETRRGARDFEEEVAKIAQRNGGHPPQIHSAADGAWAGRLERYRDGIDNGIARARTPGHTAEAATPERVSGIKGAGDAETLIDPRTGNKYMYSAEKKAMLVIAADGTETVQEGAHSAARFKQLFNEIGEHSGKMPSVIKGGMHGLTEFLENGGTAAKMLGKYGDDAARLASLIGKFSKVLPAVGAIAAGYELYQYMQKADTAERMGVLSREAVLEYKAICCGNGLAGLGGFVTSTGGEAAALAAFKLWADKHHVPEYMRNDLRPSGLVSMAVDALAKAETPKSQDGIQLASAALPGTYNTSSPLSTKVFVNSLLPESAIANLGNSPVSTMPPEMQTVVQRVQAIQNLEGQMGMQIEGTDTWNALLKQKQTAEQNLANTFTELNETGGFQNVADYSAGYRPQSEFAIHEPPPFQDLLDRSLNSSPALGPLKR